MYLRYDIEEQLHYDGAANRKRALSCVNTNTDML